MWDNYVSLNQCHAIRGLIILSTQRSRKGREREGKEEKGRKEGRHIPPLPRRLHAAVLVQRLAWRAAGIRGVGIAFDAAALVGAEGCGCGPCDGVAGLGVDLCALCARGGAPDVVFDLEGSRCDGVELVAGLLRCALIYGGQSLGGKGGEEEG